MSLINTKAAYGWIAIALHWISAIGVPLLYFLGEQMEHALTRPDKIAARNLHVSVAVLLFSFLAARIIWSATQTAPAPLEQKRALQILGKAVQGLFLVMVALLLISGPLTVWSTAKPLQVFELFYIPSPFPTRLQWLHEAGETVHKFASNAFWPLIILHVGGALKHLIIDRDRTVQRMLWVSKSSPEA